MAASWMARSKDGPNTLGVVVAALKTPRRAAGGCQHSEAGLRTRRAPQGDPVQAPTWRRRSVRAQPANNDDRTGEKGLFPLMGCKQAPLRVIWLLGTVEGQAAAST
jgi:hypothetical protein